MKQNRNGCSCVLQGQTELPINMLLRIMAVLTFPDTTLVVSSAITLCNDDSRMHTPTASWACWIQRDVVECTQCPCTEILVFAGTPFPERPC